MNVRFKKLDPRAQTPKYARPGDAGMDLHALERVAVPAGQIVHVKTGIAIQLPDGYEAQIRGRSSMNKKGMWVPTGTIDQGYTGDLGVLVRNMTPDLVWLETDKAIAQLVVSRVASAEMVEVDELAATVRGAGGFGSTNR